MTQSVSDLGEFGLIAAVTRGLSASDAVRVGVGDDCAVLAAAGDIAVSTDSMIEDVHFKRSWSSAHDVGRKLVGSSMADVEAMGATPLALVVSASLPPSLDASWALGLMEGVRAECERCGASLVGGDTTAGDKIALTCTVLGDMAGRRPVLRSGAHPGDVVAFVGQLGMAEAGLAVLRRGFRSPAAVVNAHRVPSPPWGQGAVASDAGATAMLDCSDGLVADLRHIAEASGVSIDINADALEVGEPQKTVAAAIGGGDPLQFILHGGEDHALLATFPSADAVPPGWTVIGAVSDGDPVVTLDGAPVEGAGGWRHF